MPWQDNSGKQNPWGNQEFNPEQLIKQLKNMLGKGFSGIWLIVVAVVLRCGAFSCFYTIQPGEAGVVQRFGKFVRITDPGLNLKLTGRA